MKGWFRKKYMSINLDILREQLQQLRHREEMLFKHQAIIKNWCVTVWIAVLVAIVKKKYLNYS